MSSTARSTAAASHGPPRVGPPERRSSGDPPGIGFDAILELQARTAPAEGQTPQTDTTKRAVTDAPPSRRDAGSSAEEAEASGEPTPVTGPPPAVVDPAPAVVDPASAPMLAGGAADAGDAAGADVALSATEMPIAPGGEPVMAEVDSATDDIHAALAGVVAAADPDTGAAAAGEARSASGPPPVATTPNPASGAPEPEAGSGPGDGPEPAAPVPDAPAAGPAPDQLRRALEALGDGGREPAAPPVAATQHPAAADHVTASAPVASGPSGPAATGAPFGAQQVQRIQALIDLAGRHGAASARIELNPEELGKVEVRLRSITGGGLTASITADRPEALVALQAAGDQLRQALEDRGVELHRLDISLAADARDQARAGAQRDGRDGEGRPARGRDGTDAITDDPDDYDRATAPRSLIGGALVDVRA